jgi:membrane-associated phospholipid phosphatase
MASMRHSPDAPAHERVVPGMLRPLTHPILAIVLGVVAVLIVAGFGFVLAKGATVTGWDLAWDQYLSSIHIPALVAVGHAIYLIFSPVEAIALVVVLTLIVLLVTRKWRSALTFALTIGVTWLSSDIVKILVNRPRPLASALRDPFLPTPTDPSFPSGHAVFATAIAITFIFLVRGTGAKTLTWILAILLVLVVCGALVYIGVHYPSDVIGSIIWSIGVAPAFLAIWDNWIVPRTYPRKTLAPVTPAAPVAVVASPEPVAGEAVAAEPVAAEPFATPPLPPAPVAAPEPFVAPAGAPDAFAAPAQVAPPAPPLDAPQPPPGFTPPPAP